MTAMTDEDIDAAGATMVAASPLGPICDQVWELGGDVDEDQVPELESAIRAHVISEAAATGWAPRAWDDQLLAGITKLVAVAMIDQHRFSEALVFWIHRDSPLHDPDR